MFALQSMLLKIFHSKCVHRTKMNKISGKNKYDLSASHPIDFDQVLWCRWRSMRLHLPPNVYNEKFENKISARNSRILLWIFWRCFWIWRFCHWHCQSVCSVELNEPRWVLIHEINTECENWICHLLFWFHPVILCIFMLLLLLLLLYYKFCCCCCCCQCDRNGFECQFLVWTLLLKSNNSKNQFALPWTIEKNLIDGVAAARRKQENRTNQTKIKKRKAQKALTQADLWMFDIP